MTVKQRVERSLLIEKIHKEPELSRKIGLEDASLYRGKRVCTNNIKKKHIALS